jgi:BTB/POZ domain-containing adapter for CUL3-mediated RhoA degradation protein
VLTDHEGWILIDRGGKHFSLILNFLRDGTVAMPDCQQEVKEIINEAKYYCIQVTSFLLQIFKSTDRFCFRVLSTPVNHGWTQ